MNRRLLSRLCIASALALVGLGFWLPSASGETDPRPPSFEGRAFASAIQLSLNTKPPQLVPEIVRIDLPHGESRLEASGNPYARAASLWPGLAVDQGPGLAWGQFWSGLCGGGFPCDQFGFPPPNPVPPYPLVAEAPTVDGKADDEAGLAGQTIPAAPLFTFTAHQVAAHADNDTATTTAIIGNLDLVRAADGAVVHARKVEATTKQFFDKATLVTTSISKLSDVALLGGQVKIESLVAKTISRNDGDNDIETDSEITVGGVTAGGQPAKLTEDGVVVGDGARDQAVVGGVTEGAKRLFSSGGQTVRLLDEQADDEDGTATSDAVGVLVEFFVDGSGFPSGTGVTGHLVLGAVQSAAFASFTDPAGGVGGDLGGIGDNGGGIGSGGAPADSGFGSTPSGGGEFLGSSGGSGAPSGSGATTGSGRRQILPTAGQEELFSLENLAGDGLAAVYVAWAGALGLLVVGFRLSKGGLGA